MAISFDHSLTEDYQWLICVVTSQLGVAANEEVSTTEPSTLTTTPQTILCLLNMASVLLKISPVRPAIP